LSFVVFLILCLGNFVTVVAGNKNDGDREYGQEFIEYFHGRFIEFKE